MSPRRPKRLLRGLSLIELLVVVSTVTLLVSLTLPAVQTARSVAQRATCQNHLRQLGIALHAAHAAQQKFPVGSHGTRFIHPTERHQIAWTLSLLPYLDAATVWDATDPMSPYDSWRNHRPGGTQIPTLLCPTSRGVRPANTTGDRNGNGNWDPGDDLALTDYGGMFGAGLPHKYEFMNGILIYEEPIAARDITDGLSHTIIVGEDAGRPVEAQTEWLNGQNIFDQTGPINKTRNNELFSDHPGGVHVAFADGSAHWLAEAIDLSLLLGLCSRNSGDAIPMND